MELHNYAVESRMAHQMSRPGQTSLKRLKWHGAEQIRSFEFPWLIWSHFLTHFSGENKDTKFRNRQLVLHKWCHHCEDHVITQNQEFLVWPLKKFFFLNQGSWGLAFNLDRVNILLSISKTDGLFSSSTSAAVTPKQTHCIQRVRTCHIS